MKTIIRSLPSQMIETVKLMQRTKPVRKDSWRRILVCGMGGSGISGDLLQVLYPMCDIVVNKDYIAPEYIDRNTFAIVISYSGNTEETLNVHSILKKRGACIIAISSDGALLKKKSNLKIPVPAGLPPRGALGYLFTPLPLLLHRHRFIRSDPEAMLVSCARFLRRERIHLETKARRIAHMLRNRLTIIYANSPLFFSAAQRWQCQFNENAKTLCHINIIPEMNHNEIVGLGRPNLLRTHSALIFLNDPHAYRRNQRRTTIIRHMMRTVVQPIINIEPQGCNNLQRLFWVIMLGDYVSYYLAIMTRTDPIPVSRIDYLKKKLKR